MIRFASAISATRLAWFIVPLAIGPSLGEALDGSARAVQLTGASLAWGGWAALLVAVLIPRTMSLTAIRIGAPAALCVAGWAGLAGERGLLDVISVTSAALATVIVFTPATGEAFVNGSSYGDERRLPLRAPASLLLGPIELAWAAALAAPIGVPLLVADRQWIAGGLLLVAGAPAAWVAVRALHGLSRRWVVLVPAGIVLHDLHALLDPVLFPRAAIARLGPADPDSPALDLTQGAMGLAVEIELREPLDVAPRHRDGAMRVEAIDRLLFAPTRPGAVLREARRRRVAVD